MNIQMLTEKMASMGLSKAQLAEKIGMDRATLYRKLSQDGAGFTVSEVRSIGIALALSYSDIQEIFFENVVA